MQIKSNYTFNKKKIKSSIIWKKPLQNMVHIRKKSIIAILGSSNHYYSYNILSKCLKEETNKCVKGPLPFVDNDLLIIFIDIYRHVWIWESIFFLKSRSIIKMFRFQRKTFWGLQSLFMYSVSNGIPFCFHSISLFLFSKKTLLFCFCFFPLLCCFPYIFLKFEMQFIIKAYIVFWKILEMKDTCSR